MNNPAKGNMYEVTLAKTRETFAPFLQGCPTALVCIISSSTLQQREKDALENALVALGYGSKICTWVTLQTTSNLQNSSHPASAQLDRQTFFQMIEGLDPLCLIVTDTEAASLAGQAYRQSLSPNTPCRLLGRNTVVFGSFASLLDNPQGKQKAWALLKALPKYGER